MLAQTLETFRGLGSDLGDGGRGGVVVKSGALTRTSGDITTRAATSGDITTRAATSGDIATRALASGAEGVERAMRRRRSTSASV